MEHNLVIQLGNAKDVIATLALIEKIHDLFPEDELIVVVDDQNKSLVEDHPFIGRLINWDSGEKDLKNLKSITGILKKVRFKNIYNASTSLNAAILTFRLKAEQKFGFKKSGLNAFLNFNVELKKLSADSNMMQQILSLIGKVDNPVLPKLHIKKGEEVELSQPYFLLAPMPDEPQRNYKYLIWEKLLERLPQKIPVYVICDEGSIKATLNKFHKNLNFLSDPLDYQKISSIVNKAHKVFATQNVIGLIAATTQTTYSIAVAQGNYSKDYDFEPQKTLIYNNTAGRNEAIKLYSAKELEQDLNIFYSEQEKMTIALQILRDGGVIVHETDTIPGLAVNSINSLAVESLYRIKERDPSKAMLILCSDMRMAKDYVHKVPPIVFDLVDAAGEDPLTIIYPHAKNLPDNLLASDGSIGIRIPQSEKLQFMIARHGFPLVSTSANKSGDPAPSDMSHLQEGLFNKVDMILDIPFKEKGSAMASTIVKIKGEELEVIRMGKVNEKLKKMLEKV